MPVLDELICIQSCQFMPDKKIVRYRPSHSSLINNMLHHNGVKIDFAAIARAPTTIDLKLTTVFKLINFHIRQRMDYHGLSLLTQPLR